MKVLFWMFSGFDRHITSGHLLSAVIERLCESGHHVHVIQKNTGGSLPSIPDTLSQLPITTDAVSFSSAEKGNFIARYLKELNYIKTCRKYITADYDAVFLQSNNVAGFALREIRKKLPQAIVTFNVQDIFPYNAVLAGKLKKNSIAFKILAAVQRHGYKNADHIITISEDMKDTLVDDGVDEAKIEVVYNWSYQDEPYDYSKLDYNVVSHMFSKNYFNVVYAGNIGVMQNVELIVEAARLMKDDETVWFHIIGNGVYKEKLQAKAKEYGIKNISFWPMQPPELAPVIYSAADVNVIPLVKDGYKTALPSKTATCLACGKPIIFAIGKDSKFGEIISTQPECFAVESDDAIQLTNIVGKIKTDTDYANTCSFFMEHCNKSRNSYCYAKRIVGER